MKNKIIKAQDGKVFRRISDGFIFGNEISLGYTYYLNGEKLEEPLLELPEHFEEIDEPVMEFPEYFGEIDKIVKEVNE